jgi:hypothetical protein
MTGYKAREGQTRVAQAKLRQGQESDGTYRVIATFYTESEAMDYIVSKEDEKDLYITKDMFNGSYEVVKIG